MSDKCEHGVVHYLQLKQVEGCSLLLLCVICMKFIQRTHNYSARMFHHLTTEWGAIKFGLWGQPRNWYGDFNFVPFRTNIRPALQAEQIALYLFNV
jgi:hypothetical protein